MGGGAGGEKVEETFEKVQVFSCHIGYLEDRAHPGVQFGNDFKNELSHKSSSKTVSN